MIKLNKVKERYVFLSPTVQAGWDDQSTITDFELIQKLGKGSFGEVKKYKHKKTQKIYAIKQIDKKLIKQRNMIQQVKNQLKIQYSLNHSNIIKLYSHFQDNFCIYLIIQFAENGQLYKYLLNKPNRKLEQELTSRITYQVLMALHTIHAKKIIHRDIKPQNILLDSKLKVKIADFGWANYLQPFSKRTTFCGTLDYLAPQMLEKQHIHDYKVDIWAVGVLIFELSSGLSPFSMSMNQNLSENKIKENIKNVNYTIPFNLSNNCKDLITKILVKNPDLRLSLQEILMHPWFENCKPQKIENSNNDWLNDLRKQFELVNITENGVFSKQEIYQFSRMESIINKKDEKKEKQKGEKTKLHGMQMKVKDLELRILRDEAEIYQLKKQRGNHDECNKIIKQWQLKYANLKIHYQLQYQKLMLAEGKVKQLWFKLHQNKINQQT